MAKTNGATNHQIAPVIRGAFLRGLDEHCKKRGLSRGELMAELIEQHGLLAVMDRVAKFAERVSTSTVNLESESLVSVLSALNERAGRHPQVESQPEQLCH